MSDDKRLTVTANAVNAGVSVWIGLNACDGEAVKAYLYLI